MDKIIFLKTRRDGSVECINGLPVEIGVNVIWFTDVYRLLNMALSHERPNDLFFDLEYNLWSRFLDILDKFYGEPHYHDGTIFDSKDTPCHGNWDRVNEPEPFFKKPEHRQNCMTFNDAVELLTMAVKGTVPSGEYSDAECAFWEKMREILHENGWIYNKKNFSMTPPLIKDKKEDYYEYYNINKGVRK